MSNTSLLSAAPSVRHAEARSLSVPNVAIYTGGDPTKSTTPGLFQAIQQAAYTTAVLWAAHVDAAGDIKMNDDLVASGGALVPTAEPWALLVTQLRKGKVNFIELSIGGDDTSFANIKALISKYGTGAENPLYGNLQALQSALTLDAIDYDDETEYDHDSSLALAAMCADLGMSISICPYMNRPYWVKLVKAINNANPGAVVASYLQCYSGGSGNDPAEWNKAFQGIGLNMTPGLDVTTSKPSQAQTQFTAWVNEPASLAGGFMFVGTAMMGTDASRPDAYATAMAQGLEAGTAGPRLVSQ